MSKKSRKNRHRRLGSVIAAPTAVIKPPAASVAPQKAPTIAQSESQSGDGLWSLEDLFRRGEELIDADDWQELLNFGRTPLHSVREADREDAETWLLTVVLCVLLPTNSNRGSIYRNNEAEQKEVLAALKRLAELSGSTFYRNPWYRHYLWHVHPKTIEADIEAFHGLNNAFWEEPSLQLLWELRTYGILLLDPESSEQERVVSEGDRQLLRSLPSVSFVLQEAFAAGEDLATTAEDKAKIKLFQMDLEIRTAKPCEVEKVVAAIREIPSPDSKAVRALMTNREGPEPVSYPLTPQAWAFLTELESAQGSADLSALFKRYSDSFGSATPDALWFILVSAYGPESEREAALAKAVGSLMDHLGEPGVRFGHGMAVPGPDDTVIRLEAGWEPFRTKSVEWYLYHLRDCLHESYLHKERLHTLIRVIDGAENYETGVADGPSSTIDQMPGLRWLCDQNADFQFLASTVVEGWTLAASLRLEAACRLAGTESAHWIHGYTQLPEETTELTPTEGEELLGWMERLAEQHEKKPGHPWCGWTVAQVFKGKLSSACDKHRLLKVARVFEAELQKAGLHFTLAYYEQVAGHPYRATRHYLACFDKDGKASSATVSNLEILSKNVADPVIARGVAELLRAELEGDAEPGDLGRLVALFDEKVETLERQAKKEEETIAAKKAQQEQFEKTAVQRWPSLSAPARKLLGVLANINSFSGYDELAQYAGMDEKWARIHYGRLVELGMVIDQDGRYRINPHIAPLLQRESQHTVVGRIVRAQGTFAIKQVFNSQREFGIYQVMLQLCPNHLVLPNCSLQSIISFDRLKELVDGDDFSYYLKASVDLVVASTTTYLPMLAVEVDSVWHDTSKQTERDERKDRIFAASGIPLLRLRPVGDPSPEVIRGEVAGHFSELVNLLRPDLPGFEQARALLEDLSGVVRTPPARSAELLT